MQRLNGKRLSLAFLLSLALTILVGCGSSSSGSGSVPSNFTVGSGTAVLSWAPPMTNTDGSPVDLMGFSIYVGGSAGSLQFRTMVGVLDTTTVIDNLAVGTHFFAVKAVSITGAESDFSNIASKTISPS